jgi:lysozyme
VSFDALLAALKIDEGLRLKPYLDTATPPRITIGYGTNIGQGITIQEAHDLLMGRAIRAQQAVAALVFRWGLLNDVRKNALSNLCYQVGASGFAKFKKMLAAINRDDFETAADEMLDSDWARRYVTRATRLAQEMRTGRTA